MKLDGEFRARVGRESHPSRGAWIEISTATRSAASSTSHPSRGAWIEIPDNGNQNQNQNVAPLTGCVD